MKEQDKKQKNTNAFPLEYTNGDFQTGMTLRDYFAAKTLQGISSLEDKGSYSTLKEAIIHQAEYCYKVADEMLKQREL